MEHRRVCFCMLSLLPLVQISKLSQANSLLFGKVCCRTPRGVRGLKFCPALSRARCCSRTPRGVRGLKSPMESSRGQIYLVSHPSRGAWIEIAHGLCAPDHRHSRTPRGVRGLKWNYYDYVDTLRGRTPRGVRGLKCTCHATVGGYPGRTPRGVRGLKLCFGELWLWAA